MRIKLIEQMHPCAFGISWADQMQEINHPIVFPSEERANAKCRSKFADVDVQKVQPLYTAAEIQRVLDAWVIAVIAPKVPRPSKYRVGQRYGSLVLVSRDGSDTLRSKWVVRCDCGRETTKQIGHITRGITQTCGKGACRKPGSGGWNKQNVCNTL